MIHMPLFGHATRRQGPFLVACALLLGAFQFLIGTIVHSIHLGSMLESLMKSLPPLMQTLIVSQFGGLSERDILAFAWNHPVTHALGTAVAIVFAARAIAGEIETGTLELLLVEPLTRRSYFMTRVTAGLGALVVLSLAGIAGSALAQEVYHLQSFERAQMLVLGVDYFLLLAAWFAITLAFSAYGNEGGRVASAGFLVALVSYILQVIGGLWPAADFLLPWTLHHDFVPRTILIERGPVVRPLLTLGAVTIVALGVAARHFERRDVP
jgi:beta-exotoxin I transport system permease protein